MTGPTGSTGTSGPTGATGFLQNGTVTGQTPHWDNVSQTWIIDTYLYNDGSFVGVGTTAPQGGEIFGVAGEASATIFSDWNDQTYYLDMANAGVSLLTAGKVGIGTTQVGTGLSNDAMLVINQPNALKSAIYFNGNSATISANNLNIILDPCGDGGAGACGKMVQIGDGATKLNVGTLDPPYTINGEKYATFVPSMIGQKEEVAGTLATTEYVPGTGYRSVIKFAETEKASDLWLFMKVTNLPEHINDMVVLLTPSGNAKAWYEIDKNSLTLSIFTSRPTTVSYRLTAPRFDAEKWTNIRSDGGQGHVLNSPDPIPLTASGSTESETFSIIPGTNGSYTLINQAGIIIEDFGAFSQSTIANLTAGAIKASSLLVQGSVQILGNLTAQKVEAPEVKTDTITPLSPTSDGIDISLSDTQKLAITNPDGTPKTTIDNQGNITTTGDLTVSGTINSEASISATSLSAKDIIAKNADIETIKTKNLTAEHIQTSFGDLDTRLESMDTSLSSTLDRMATLSAQSTTEIPATISAQLDTLQQGLGIFETPDIDLTGKTLDIDGVKVAQNLSVIGTSTLGATSIAGSLMVDATVLINENGITSIGEPLFIQKSKLSVVDIMGGTLVIDPSGDVIVNGDLAVTGDMTIGGTLGVSTIRPTMDNIEVSLNKTASSSSFGTFLINGKDNKPVVRIDASGSADFAGNLTASGSATVSKLNISLNDSTASSSSGQIANTEATIGTAVLSAGTSKITVNSNQVTDASLLYITPITSTGNQVLYVKEKLSGTGFTVAIDSALPQDIRFNWWIVN